MPLSRISYKQNPFDVSYKVFNLDAQIDIVFLHGWGSNKEALIAAFSTHESLKSCRLIFVDLPGFGESRHNDVLNTFDYRAIVEIFFAQIEVNPKMIVGHSFGGKVATLLEASHTVLLSSAGILEEKPLSVRIKIYVFKVFRYLGLGFLRRIFAANDGKNLTPNMYETFKQVIAEDFKDIFAQSSSRFSIFWGLDDKQTSVESGKLIASLTQSRHFEVMKGDHFFFMDKSCSKVIAQHICDVLHQD